MYICDFCSVCQNPRTTAIKVVTQVRTYDLKDRLGYDITQEINACFQCAVRASQLRPEAVKARSTIMLNTLRMQLVSLGLSQPDPDILPDWQVELALRDMLRKPNPQPMPLAQLFA